MSVFDEMVGLTEVNKTLEFQLKPVGENTDFVEDFKSDYLKKMVEDSVKDCDYSKRIKEILRDFFKESVHKKLENLEFFNRDILENSFEYFKKLGFKKWLSAKVVKGDMGNAKSDFELLLSLNLFNASVMSDAVHKFRRYEDSSLGYLGIKCKEIDKIGLFYN